MVTARLRGVNVCLPSRLHCAEVYYANDFDRHERAIIDRIVHSGSTVLDIGANIGLYTCLFAHKVGPSGQVMAFEPEPGVFSLLKRNVGLNDFGDRVQLFNIALSDRKGTADFNVFPEAGSVYNSLGSTKAYGLAACSTIPVPTDTLDRVLADVPLSEMSLIKIDAEGAESMVIEGAGDVLSRVDRTVVVAELNEEAAAACSSSIERTIDVMQRHGFIPFKLSRSGELKELQSNDIIAIKDKLDPMINVFFSKSARFPAVY
jgi:FkbM family methyltransferase